MLRDTENLLMDFDMQPGSIEVLDDTIVSVPDPTSDDDAIPDSPPAATTSRPRARVNRRRVAPSHARLTNFTATELIDLSSPMPPPRSTTRTGRVERTTRRPTTARGRNRRSGGSSSEESAVIVALDDSIDVRAGPSGRGAVKKAKPKTPVCPPPPPLDDSDASMDSSRPHCPICLCNWSAPVSTLCGHIFCKACIAQWLKQTKACPVCKAGAKMMKTHPIFIA